MYLNNNIKRTLSFLFLRHKSFPNIYFRYFHTNIFCLRDVDKLLTGLVSGDLQGNTCT